MKTPMSYLPNRGQTFKARHKHCKNHDYYTDAQGPIIFYCENYHWDEARTRQKRRVSTLLAKRYFADSTQQKQAEVDFVLKRTIWSFESIQRIDDRPLGR